MLTKASYSMITGAPVNVLDYGATGDGTTDDTSALQSAINAAQGKQLFWPKPSVSYKITSGLTMTGHFGSSWVQESGALIDASAIATNDFVLTMTNCQNCNIQINASTLYNGVLVEQSGTGSSLNNTISPYLYTSNNRAASKPASPVAAATRFGIKFKGATVGYANYFNLVVNPRIFQFECCVLFEDNANANFITTPEFEGYWWGTVFYGQECQLIGGFGNVAEGTDASNLTEFFRIGDGITASRYNVVVNCAVEPGNFSRAGLIQANAQSNYILCMINSPYGILDNGIQNTIITQQSSIIPNINLLTVNIAPTAAQTSTGEYDVVMFGDGTNAQTGAFSSGFKMFGGGTQTRYNRISQDYVTGNLLLEQLIAGTIQLKAPTGQGIIVGSGAWNGNPLRLGGYYLWVDSSGRLRIKSSAPTSDTDGTVVGTQT